MLLLARSHRVVTFVIWVWQSIPAPIFHNLDKARILKLLFWHLNVDKQPGFYLEFGVAHGHSLKSAIYADRVAQSQQIAVTRMPRSFYGLDTFEGFSSSSEKDKHPIWKGANFSKSFNFVVKRFKRSKEHINLFKFDATLLNEETNSKVKDIESSIKGYAAIILFDMDLYEPTLNALIWSKKYMQPGTFLIFDEFFSFSGDQRKGECAAFREFSKLCYEWDFREFTYYGSGGKVFQIAEKLVPYYVVE